MGAGATGKAKEPKRLDISAQQAVSYAVPVWLRDLNIESNLRRPGVGRLTPHEGPLRPERIALVNFGPSLRETWEGVRDCDLVMTCSGAHRFMVERAIIPYAHADVDPRAHKCCLLGTPQRDCLYLIANTCHPSLFDLLEGFNVKLWHVFDGTEEGWRMLPHGEYGITGGCSIGIRLLTLARFMGFTKFEVFGMDGCIAENGGTHAADHPNAPPGYSLVEYEGETYRTTPAMLEAARGTWHELDMLPDVTANFHGTGLVQAMARNYQRKVLTADPPMALSKPSLISAEYADLNRQLHRENLMYGTGAGRHAPVILKLVESLTKPGAPPPAVLDYGCGKSMLQKALPFALFEYDPCILGKEASPRVADLVCCLDVLEHIEPERLDFVLDDLRRVTRQVGYLVISTVPAKKVLPDGTNTHRIVRGRAFWESTLSRYFAVGKVIEKPGELHVVVGPLAGAQRAAVSVRRAA